MSRAIVRTSRATAASLLVVVGAAAVFAIVGTRGEQVNEADEHERVLAFQDALSITTTDYEPVTGPAELADQAQVVVLGQIAGFRDGPSYLGYVEDGEEYYYDSTVMDVEVYEVLAGKLPDDVHGRVYLELPLDDQNTSERMSRIAPTKAEVLLYLSERPVPDQIVKNPAAGRPAGQPLMGVTGGTPQGFLIHVGDRVYRAFDPDTGASQALPGRHNDLRDFGPPNVRFPVENP